MACPPLDADCIRCVLGQLGTVRERSLAMAVSREWRRVGLEATVLWTRPQVRTPLLLDANLRELIRRAANQLETLEVQSDALSSRGLHGLEGNRKLTALELCSSRISGAELLRVLPSLTALHSVKLGGCIVSRAELGAIKAILPRSCEFDLDECELCHAIAPCMRCMDCNANKCATHGFESCAGCASCACAECLRFEHFRSCDKCAEQWCETCCDAEWHKEHTHIPSLYWHCEHTVCALCQGCDGSWCNTCSDADHRWDYDKFPSHLCTSCQSDRAAKEEMTRVETGCA